MKIVAFDLGTTWAYAETGGLVSHRTCLGDNRAEKLSDFAAYLGEPQRAFRVFDLVIYERPFTRGLAATRMLWGMAGILEAYAARHCAVLDASPSEIKFWATGRGHAPKDHMIARAQELGYRGENEHEADAFLLLKYAEEKAE
jgi:Holliday junction resolvasome RuvABC endonuclease subunit